MYRRRHRPLLQPRSCKIYRDRRTRGRIAGRIEAISAVKHIGARHAAENVIAVKAKNAINVSRTGKQIRSVVPLIGGGGVKLLAISAAFQFTPLLKLKVSMPSPKVDALNWFLTVMISPVAVMVILRSLPNL